MSIYLAQGLPHGRSLVVLQGSQEQKTVLG